MDSLVLAKSIVAVSIVAVTGCNQSDDPAPTKDHDSDVYSVPEVIPESEEIASHEEDGPSGSANLATQESSLAALEKGDIGSIFSRARELAKVEGLESSWEVIQLVEDDSHRYNAVAGWLATAVAEDVQFAARAFRVLSDAMADGWTPEKRDFVGFGRLISVEWMKTDEAAAEEFAISLSPGMARVSALMPFIDSRMRRIHKRSEPGASEAAVKRDVRNEVITTLEQWALTPDEMNAFQALLNRLK
ncbi:MAG: hypothetical protein R3F19_22865 [Verrucomicrobiales bacterium]